jgi:uncharacterized cupin superfamily protein
MRIRVEKPTPADIAAFSDCATWSKEPSVFDWEYDSIETCYLLQGDVRVTTADGEVAEFGAGDMVTFPAGLKCTWEVRAPVHKHYRFG